MTDKNEERRSHKDADEKPATKVTRTAEDPAYQSKIPSSSSSLCTDPPTDPYKKAITYLEKHHVLQIFQTLTANIILKKPENPVDFIISEIAELKRNRDGCAPK